MAALIYYTHVLGDHCYNTHYTVNDRIPLARRTENESNPSLIFDLKKHVTILFSEQKEKKSSDYRSLNDEMNRIHDAVRDLLGNNDYPSIEQYTSYQDYAKQLMRELKDRIPRLLADSSFFPTVFMEPAA